MAFFRGVAALYAFGRSSEATPTYAYYGSRHESAEGPPSYTYYSSSHNYYGGSKHISADETFTCGFQGTDCSFPGGVYPVGLDDSLGGGGGVYSIPGGLDDGGFGLYPNPGLGDGNGGGVILDGECRDPRGCADDHLPGIPLTDAQLALVRKMASQAADGLSTTIQLLQQDRQSGPVGNLFEQLFSDKLSKNLADEQFVQDRLQDVLNMMTTHPDRIKYVYCTEGEGDYDCPEDQGVVAFVLSGGEFGETDETEFTVHLGKIWWNAVEEWGEGCKAGVLIHEYTHHVFHTQDLGYNFEGKALTDEEKKQNAAAYQNLVVEVMVARQKNEL